MKLAAKVAMPTRVIDIWQRLVGSLWFIPAVIVSGAAVLAVGMVDLSGAVDSKALEKFPRLFGADAQSSRSMLASIAGSLITVAGVSFSIIVVAVAQASNQYTPRILRSFMRDRPMQVTLGVLMGAFVYCLVVLRTIRGGDDLQFVPSVAVLAAFGIAIVALGFFVYFIHHTAQSLEVGSIIERVSGETVAAVHRAFPRELGTAMDEDERTPRLRGGEEWHVVCARSTGYIQSIDADGLLDLACSEDIVIRMDRGIGEFVARDTPLAAVSPRAPDEATVERLNGRFAMQSYRTVFQDPAFGIRQLVDIALKALSPGINDSTTARTCVEYIGAVLVQLANRDTPSPFRVADGELRVIVRVQEFEQMLTLACEEIRRCASGNPPVLVALLSALQQAGAAASSPRRRELLREHADRILATARDSIPGEHDREEVVRAHEGAARVLGTRGFPAPLTAH